MDEDADFQAQWLKALTEMYEDTAQRRESKAKEMGFSSYEEYKTHKNEQGRIAKAAYKKRQDERCKLLNKTSEELDAIDYPYEEEDVEGLYRCDCEGEFTSTLRKDNLTGSQTTLYPSSAQNL